MNSLCACVCLNVHALWQLICSRRKLVGSQCGAHEGDILCGLLAFVIRKFSVIYFNTICSHLIFVPVS